MSMAGIDTKLLLDIADFAKALQSAVSQSRGAVAQIQAAASDGARGFSTTAAAVSRVSGNMTQAAGSASQFGSAVRKTATAAAGIAAITAAAITLNRRFPQVAAGAMAAFARIRAGAATAARSAGPVSMSLVKIASRGAAVAAAVQTMAAAYRFLFGNASRANAEMAKTKAPSGGGGGGGKGSFLGAMLGGAAGGGIGSMIGSAIVGGIKGAASQIKSAIATPLAAAADEETLKVSLGVLVGDEGKTDALLADLQKRAADTPLEFGELAEGASMLIAFGESADGVGDTLQRIGDVAAGVRAPLGQITEIYGKARVQNQLFAEDINQLTGRGIPVIGEFAKQLGVSESEVKKLASEGQITFPMLEKAFVSLTSEGGKFSGMLSKQADTVRGKMSTLADAISMNWKAFGAPINDALKPLLDIAIEKVESLRERAAEIGAAAATGLRQIVAAIGVIASMPMAEIGKVLGAALRGAAVGVVNFLYRGLVAAFSAGGQILSEYGRAAVALIGIVNKADFWKGMASALTGLAKTFAAAILEGVSHVIKGMKESMGAAGRKVFGNADERLSSQADSLRASAAESAKDGGFNLAPYLREAMAGVGGSLSRIAEEFSRVFSETGNVLNLPAESAALLSDFAAQIKQVMAEAKNATGKTAGASGGGAGGDGGTGKAKTGLPAIAGRLAGAMNMIGNRARGEVLQAEGNTILREIADNTRKDTKPQPKVISPVARAMGVFS